MYQHTTSALRRGWAALLLAGLGVFATPTALAATNCNPNGYQVSPKNQNNILEFDAANNYSRNLVHLGISKALDVGAVPTWSEVSGPAVSLDTSNPFSPSFLTPDVPAAGATLTFRLTVTCPDGSNASNDGTVSIINVNRPPTAYASAAPPIAFAGDAVVLHSYAPAGSPISNDPDGDALTYSWTRTAGPAVTLVNAATPTASFTAPTTGSPYTLQFLLTIRDRPTGGLTSTAAVVVNVSQYLPPIARLVCPDHVNELGHVLLDGSTSSDPNGGALTYQWTQLQGSPAIAVGGEAGNSVQFNAPLLTTGQDGLLEFQLKVSDSRGLFDLATCMTQINDVTAPVITVPANITAEATSAAGALVAYDASAQDAVDDAAPYLPACVPPSGSVFPLAAPPTQQKTTAVACTAHDTAGNTANAGFNVTVRDSTPPVITVPGALGVEATGPGGATATFSAPTSDAVDGAGSATCVPASGSSFALGTTPVACNATDARGNAAAPAGFNLTVHDTTRPVIAAHGDVTAEATGSGGASVSYVSPATSDLVDGSGTATCAPASDSAFALGTTAVDCNATDAAGNHAVPTTFNVIVRDTIPPVIAAHANVTAEATGPNGANVGYVSPLTSDLVDGSGTATCTPAAGSLFQLGSSTVTCTAKDAAHNSAAPTTFTINVVDTTPPTIDPHAAIDDVEATGPGGATVAYDSPATHDLVDGDGTATCAPASGTLFALGGTIVTCHADDAAHNHAVATMFAVNVVDTTPPAIDAHDAIGPIEATGPYGAHVDYTSPATHDAVDGDGAAACLPASGSAFGLGLNSVTCNAADHAGNAAPPTTFTIEVVDTTPPVIAAHANVTEEATGPTGASVSYTSPGTTDLVDGAGTASCLPLSGSTFALGETIVHCNAADAAGNAADETRFKVFVIDTTPPVIAAHANVTEEATGPTGASVSYTSPGTADLVDGAGAAACLPVSGSTFALGETTVHCNAIDAAGNGADETRFKVFVIDTTPPVIAAHANVTEEATGPTGASVNYTSPGTTDLVDGAGAASCLPVSGSTFAFGETTVQCNAADAAGNAADETSFKVFVIDTTPPVIATHADVGPIEATGPGGAAVAYTLPSTSDAVDGSGTASCLPASGSTFALGTSLVTCHATDDAGNHALATTFQVTVRDNTAPVIAAHGNLTAEATGPGGASVGYASPATTDAVDGAGTASCAPASGSTFSLGAHTVSCNAVDAAGNHAVATSFTVTVRDTTAPAIAPHADVNVVASSNSSAVATYTTPAATDLVDTTVVVTCAPASGSTLNAGSTTVNCSATDHAGNPATSSFKVNVSYAFNGFLQPVDNTAVNTVKAGSAIPVKFGLGGNQGLAIFATNSPASVATAQCDGSATDEIEVTVTAGNSSLTYDSGANQYNYVWKTEKNWIGCRQLRMTFKDGSVRTAMFKFR